jgi:hypothetical protein
VWFDAEVPVLSSGHEGGGWLRKLPWFRFLGEGGSCVRGCLLAGIVFDEGAELIPSGAAVAVADRGCVAEPEGLSRGF